MLIESLIVNGGSELPPLRQHTTEEQRGGWLRRLDEQWNQESLKTTQEDNKDENIAHLFIRDAVAYWLARFLTRDTPTSLSIPFIRHFLQ